jgi:hypothetical protein
MMEIGMIDLLVGVGGYEDHLEVLDLGNGMPKDMVCDGKASDAGAQNDKCLAHLEL